LKVTAGDGAIMAALRDKGVQLQESAFTFPDLHDSQCLPSRPAIISATLATSATRIYTGYPVPLSEYKSFRDAISRKRCRPRQHRRSFQKATTSTRRRSSPRPRAWLSTAAVGKLGPVLIFDHTSEPASDDHLDDATGRNDKNGHPLGICCRTRSRRRCSAGLRWSPPRAAPTALPASFDKRATTVANVEQQA